MVFRTIQKNEKKLNTYICIQLCFIETQILLKQTKESVVGFCFQQCQSDVSRKPKSREQTHEELSTVLCPLQNDIQEYTASEYGGSY